MAKVSRCEGCGREAALGTFGTVPDGWFELTERRPGAEPNRHAELCSVECVERWAGELRAARAMAERLNAAERRGETGERG